MRGTHGDEAENGEGVNARLEQPAGESFQVAIAKVEKFFEISIRCIYAHRRIGR